MMPKSNGTSACIAFLTHSLLLAGCSDAPPTATRAPDVMPAQGGSGGAQGGSGGAGRSDANPPAARPRDASCTAPSGVSSSPATIQEALTLINALPKPLSLSCFLQSLARPLNINATNSSFSLQPSQGTGSPRIFVFAPAMVMSVVPAGPGAPFLEFGETRPDFRSLKAEISFPVLTQLSPDAPFKDVMFGEQSTTCAVCHAAEAPESNALGIRQFVSRALRPLPQDRVTAARLQQELASCNFALEPERCALLDGLFGWGGVSEAEFDAGMSTF